MSQDLLTAFALVLIIEGLMPAIAPAAWQKYLQDVARIQPRTIRIVGLSSMLVGAFVLQFLR